MEATGDSSPRGAFAPGQVVTVFRSRRRDESEAAYIEMAGAMEAAARAAPGFIDFKTFVAEDGESVSLVTFASPATHRGWRVTPVTAGPNSRAAMSSTSSTRCRSASAPT